MEKKEGQKWWFLRLIPPTWEAKIGGLWSKHAGAKLDETLSEKMKSARTGDVA
jgi:hypothetical protein